MSNQKWILLPFVSLLLAFTVGCGKDDKSSGALVRAMGQAKIPGKLPDGTSAPAITDQEAFEIIQSFSGTLMVIRSVMEAMPEKAGQVFALDLLPANDELKEKLKRECQFVQPDMEPVFSNVRESGSTVTGTAVIRSTGGISGYKCPVNGHTEIDAKGNFVASVTPAGELQSFNVTGEASFKEELIAYREVIDATGFISMKSALNLTGRMAMSPLSQALSLDIKGSAVIQSMDFGQLAAQVYSEVDVTVASERPQGPVAFALVMKKDERLLLIQVFARFEMPEKASIYINGRQLDLGQLNVVARK